MRSRRGEVQFVAIRVGRSNDPKEVLSLALELRTSRAEALGFVCLWEEFLLEVGDALTGRLKGYTAQHIAAKLGWRGPARKLVDALKSAGLLKTQRNVFFHPYWLQSITGQYARERAELRERWREEKRRQKEKEFQPESDGNGPDVRGDSVRKTDINRSRGSAGSAPPAPPGTGGELGAARWDWIQNNHKRPRDSRRCIPILAAMAEDAWSLCQWVVTEAKPGGALSRSPKKRSLKLDSYRFLANEVYLEFHSERRQKVEAQEQAKKNGGSSLAPATDKVAASIAFVLERLADPELPPEKKEKIRKNWIELNPGERPPWEAHGAPSGAQNAQA
jgi:hypothetical protein